MLCRPRLGWSCHVEREVDARTALRAVMNERTRELTAREKRVTRQTSDAVMSWHSVQGGDGRCFICIGCDLVLFA